MHPEIVEEAEVELQTAAIRYERARPGLGRDFLFEYLAAVERIARSPRTGVLVPDAEDFEIRRFPLHRFPYKLFVVVRDDDRCTIPRAPSSIRSAAARRAETARAERAEADRAAGGRLGLAAPQSHLSAGRHWSSNQWTLQQLDSHSE